MVWTSFSSFSCHALFSISIDVCGNSHDDELALSLWNLAKRSPACCLFSGSDKLPNFMMRIPGARGISGASPPHEKMSHGFGLWRKVISLSVLQTLSMKFRSMSSVSCRIP